MTDINDAPDKKARTLAEFIPNHLDFLGGNEYLENIRMAANRLTRAGLGDMIYCGQYSTGSTMWRMSHEVMGISVTTDGTIKL